MYDYMKALWDKFVEEPEISAVQLDIEVIHHQLIDELNKEQRRKVLMLIDKEDMRCEETSLHSFIAGFRVAFGLTVELNLTEAYSFDREEERRASSIVGREVDHDGEETS